MEPPEEEDVRAPPARRFPGAVGLVMVTALVVIGGIVAVAAVLAR